MRLAESDEAARHKPSLKQIELDMFGDLTSAIAAFGAAEF
jgi:hypothetical protein